MPVHAGAFVKPSFVLRSVNSYHDHIFFFKIDKVGYIIVYACITAFIIPHIKTIDPELCIPEHAIKL